MDFFRKNYVLTLKDFHFTEKRTEPCNICEQKTLKKQFLQQKRIFSKHTFGIYKPGLVISFLLHNNLIHKVWVDPFERTGRKEFEKKGSMRLSVSWVKHTNPTEQIYLGGNECFPKIAVS